MKFLRTLLVLGRVSNLPTVWSNCLCGWLLGIGYTGREQVDWWVFLMLALGASGLYLGGMFLNDACDAWWDREHRPERPIPAGAIREKMVWRIGIGLMATGMFFLCLPGGATAVLALLLFNTILAYNFTHKHWGGAPILMGLCRLLLILVAAAYGHTNTGVDMAFLHSATAGAATWVALVMFAYVMGLTLLAQRESVPGETEHWPLGMLVLPVILALAKDWWPFTQNVMILSLILALWIVRSVRWTWWVKEEKKNVGRTVGSLLAGIVLVDLLAVAHAPPAMAAGFICLFAMSALAQRYVPAT